MGCPGIHCDGCGGHGSGVAAGVVVLAVVAAVVAKPVAHAAADVLHALEVVLEVLMWTGAAAAGLALTGAAAYGAVRLRRWRSARRQVIGGHPVTLGAAAHAQALTGRRVVLEAVVVDDVAGVPAERRAG